MKTVVNIIITGLLTMPVFLQAQIVVELDTPGTSAKIFAEKIISTRASQRDIAISPNGDEIFYTTIKRTFETNIYYIKKNGDTWTAPTVAPFSGNDEDLEPAYSPDGQKLFFASNRGGNYDIYYVERSEDGWSNPINVGEPVNTDVNEFYPSVANDGTLYWTAAYENGKGGEDIWYSTFENGQYQNPISLDNVNTRFDEFNAFVDPDKKFIYFGSFGRADGLGGGDIYLSSGNGDGTFNAGFNMGVKVNTALLDYCPYVSPNGQYFFFTSEKDAGTLSTSNNPFDFDSLLERALTPRGNGSNIYWIRR